MGQILTRDLKKHKSGPGSSESTKNTDKKHHENFGNQGEVAKYIFVVSHFKERRSSIDHYGRLSVRSSNDINVMIMIFILDNIVKALAKRVFNDNDIYFR